MAVVFTFTRAKFVMTMMKLGFTGDIRYQSNSKGTTQMTIILPDENDGNRISRGILGKMY